MLLAIDIGNTAIKFGLFEAEQLTSKFSIPTKRDAAVDDLRRAIGERLRSGAEAAIVCSVVPDINIPMTEFLREVTTSEPTFVNNSFDFGLIVNYEPLQSLGTDRLVNAFGAVEKYGAPCIVCSLGTATTIDVVNKDREFLGGIIAPGINAMAEALHLKAPRLPDVKIERPETTIGNSTMESIRSGIYYGYVGMVEGLITRIRTEFEISRIVATGGNAVIASDKFGGIMTVDPDLILNGLWLISTKTSRIRGPNRVLEFVTVSQPAVAKNFGFLLAFVACSNA
ncbi:MAG: type III pantothenate kinase [Pyrinomonadaceae bacterium]